MDLWSPISRGRPPPPACRRTARLAAVALTVVASLARGDEAPSPEAPVTELPEVVVRRPRGEVAQAPAAATTVVDASRFAGESKGVAELLAVSPGVDVQRYGAAGQRTTVAIRGVAADGVKVLVDGLPLGGADGVVDLSTIPRAWIRRIEVVRGPAGAAFGAGALGGAVNVVTGNPKGTSAEATAGSYRSYRLDGQTAFEPGAFSILTGVTLESAENDFPYLFDTTPQAPVAHPDAILHLTRQNDAVRRAGLIVKAGGDAGGHRIDALAQVSGGERELPGSPDPNQATPNDWQRDGRAVLMARIARDLRPGLTTSARLYGRADLLDVYIASLSQETGPVRQRGGAAGVQLEAALSHPHGALTVLLSADGEGYRANALGGSRARGALAVAAIEDLKLGSRVELGLGLRGERVGTYEALSPNAGVRVTLSPSVYLRASGGRTVRIPAFAELYLRQGWLDPNPDLRPETGFGADAALVYDGPLGFLSAGAFAMRQDDVIAYEQVSHDRWKAENTPAALLRGIEVEASTTPIRRALGLTASLAWTLLRSEVLKGPPNVVGNELPRRPRQQLYARAAVHPGPLEAHLEVRQVGLQYQDRYNLPDNVVPAATTLAVGASARLHRAPHLSLHLQVDNLTDRRDLLDGYGNPLPGRSVMLTLRAGGSESAP